MNRSRFKKYGIKEKLDETYLITAELYWELNQKDLSKSYYQKSYDIAKRASMLIRWQVRVRV